MLRGAKNPNELNYPAIMGMKSDLSGPATVPYVLQCNSEHLKQEEEGAPEEKPEQEENKTLQEENKTLQVTASVDTRCSDSDSDVSEDEQQGEISKYLEVILCFCNIRFVLKY